MKMVLFVLALLAVSPAPPADPASPRNPASPAAPAPDAAAIDEAMRMLDADDFEGQLIDQTEVMVEGMIAVEIERLSKQSDIELPDELLKLITQALRDHSRDTFKANGTKLKRQAAEIYAREFTIEELQRLREIASDPVSAKQRARGQVLNAQLMMLGMAVMKESEPELERKLEQIVIDYLEKAKQLNDDKS